MYIAPAESATIIKAQLETVININIMMIAGIILCVFTLVILQLIKRDMQKDVSGLTLRDIIGKFNPYSPIVYFCVSLIIFCLGVGAVLGFVIGYDVAVNIVIEEYLKTFNYSICSSPKDIFLIQP